MNKLATGRSLLGTDWEQKKIVLLYHQLLNFNRSSFYIKQKVTYNILLPFWSWNIFLYCLVTGVTRSYGIVTVWNSIITHPNLYHRGWSLLNYVGACQRSRNRLYKRDDRTYFKWRILACVMGQNLLCSENFMQRNDCKDYLKIHWEHIEDFDTYRTTALKFYSASIIVLSATRKVLQSHLFR